MNYNPSNKINLTPEQVQYIRDHHGVITNQAIADHIGMKLRTLRTKLYDMGLFKVKMTYWTNEQAEYIRNNYQTVGDTEIAKSMTKLFPTQGGWSKKQVTCKRINMGLHRTNEQLDAIYADQVKRGIYALNATKRWQTQGSLPDGTIRFYRKYPHYPAIPYIRVNGKFKPWHRLFWEQHNGLIPEDHFIVFKGSPELLTLDNLEMVSLSELRQENNGCIDLTDNYVAGLITKGAPGIRNHIRANTDLITAKRTQLLINRKIKQLQNG